MESNDSPEIPDRGRHQKHPASLQATMQEVKNTLNLIEAEFANLNTNRTSDIF